MSDVPKLLMTLVLVRRGSQVLLALKKTKLGIGRWNGYGGKVDEGEDIETSARRELQEESGMTAHNMEKVGVCTFISPLRPPIEMHIFETRDVAGEPQETVEMGAPQWFELRDIPTAQMWKSDLLWWPEYAAGRRFTARFVFDKDDNVLEHELHDVPKD